MALVSIPKLLECLRCGHRWLPRVSRQTKDGKTDVRICPKCKSPYWDRKRNDNIK